MTGREPLSCDVPVPEHAERVRPYVNGPKCDWHAPWAAKGQAEPIPVQSRLPSASSPSPIGDSRVHDARAIASGKRQSSAFRAAQAAVGPRPAPGIRVDPGQNDARGGWIRMPNADYVCPACHQTESASGDQVAHFAAHIETEHAGRCSANPQGAQAT